MIYTRTHVVPLFIIPPVVMTSDQANIWLVPLVVAVSDSRTSHSRKRRHACIHYAFLDINKLKQKKVKNRKDAER
jgi:hypothetical protein